VQNARTGACVRVRARGAEARAQESAQRERVRVSPVHAFRCRQAAQAASSLPPLPTTAADVLPFIPPDFPDVDMLII